MACDLCHLLSAPPADVLVWQDAQLSVVLADEPNYPGFARVVWNAHVKEMTDLEPAERDHVMWAVWQVEAAQRAVMAPDKINVASFGNMTPHVHWHVIPRFATDVHFPQPTWGPAQREPNPQDLAARRALLPQLRAAIVANLNDN
ncbi:HIT family protein [Pseudoduganella ginsengisoli]|uniref:HIT domain-containing protein n=1 Tax=Pseudoduganella ginsengisoli TaxID=1462440 RepID=A0A6L6Q2S6_9BURK|nr:HIT family protein [Pseudoduganella ginsengisoli]MTW03786.1 HIT domain-containing protein [Pseudoduganella ginsengisoli]